MLADELRALATTATANRTNMAKIWAEGIVKDMTKSLYEAARDGQKSMLHSANPPFGFTARDIRLLNDALIDQGKVTGLKMSVTNDTISSLPFTNLLDTLPLKTVSIFVSW